MHWEDWHLGVLEVSGSKGWALDSTAWSFLLQRSGAAVFSGGSFRSQFRPGDVLVVPAGVAGTLTPEHAGRFSLCHFHFHAEWLSGLLRLGERYALRALVSVGAEGIRKLPATTPLARRYRSLSERMANPDTLLHRCQMLELVGMFLDLDPGRSRTPPLESLDGKERVRLVVEQMPCDQLERVSIDELARRCGCSQRHFNRILKGYLGCPLGTLKMALRLEKAASMLLNPGAKVLTVALDCGFSHVGQFSARFKTRFGTTPAVWRRQRLCLTAIASAPPRTSGERNSCLSHCASRSLDGSRRSITSWSGDKPVSLRQD